MVNVKKFPFEYIVEAPTKDGTTEFQIDTPWIDLEGEDWQDYMEQDVIYTDENLKVIEQKYDNGFHILFIQSPGKIIAKTNWELDYIEKENKFLPRIQ